MAKTQFHSGEALLVRVPAFLNTTTGALIIGTDTVTYVARRPDGTTTAATPMTFDAVTNIWLAEILPANFQAGEWRFKATSNDPTAQPQSTTRVWGDYVDAILGARRKLDAAVQRDLGIARQGAANTFTIVFNDGAGLPLNAIAATNVTLELIKAGTATSRVLTAPEFSFIANGRYRVTLPAGDFSVLGDLRLTLTDSVSGATAVAAAIVGAATPADLATTLAVMDAKIDIIRMVETNRWLVDAGQKKLTIFADDQVTPLLTFDLFDDLGQATASKIYERRP